MKTLRKTAYLPDYRVLPPAEQLKHLTHCILFSATIKKDGSLNCTKLSDKLKLVKHLQNEFGIKVSLCIGGWDRSRNFPFIIKPSMRTKFARSVAEIVNKYGLDGIDIDWEFPQNEQLNDFALTLCSIKDHLKEKELSLAVADKFKPLSAPREVFQTIDYLHVMAYDMGQDHSSYETSFDLIYNWNHQIKNRGIRFSISQIILGIPFYGRREKETLSYADLISYGALPKNEYWNGFHYNGTDTITRKALRCKNDGLGGVMMWELSQDLSVHDSDSLLKVISRSLE